MIRSRRSASSNGSASSNSNASSNGSASSNSNASSNGSASSNSNASSDRFRRATRVRAAFVALALAFGVACGSSELTESRQLLAYIDALEHPNPAERDARIGALASLPLRSNRLARLRDRCVTLHEASLEAERHTAHASDLLERLEASPQREASPLGDEMKDALSSSNRALERAERAREPCMRGVGLLRSGRLAALQ